MSGIVGLLQTVQNQLEGLPGYDILSGYYNDYAEEHFSNGDPFQDENGKRRRLNPQYNTKAEQKRWKNIQSKAWVHDRCFLGSCGLGLNCGLGLVPIVVLFPVVGPLLMYVVHSRLIVMAEKEFQIPTKLSMKLHSNIVVDLIITFPPLIGCFFGWLHGCSTRNAYLIYQYLDFLAEQRQKTNVQAPEYIGNATSNPNAPEPVYTTDRQTARSKRNRNDNIYIQREQQRGLV